MCRIHAPRLWVVLALVAVWLLAASPLAAQTADRAAVQALTSVQDLPGNGPWVVRVLTADRETIGKLAAWADVWSVERKEGIVVVQLYSAADLERLLALGLTVELDAVHTDQLTHLGIPLEGQYTGIPGYPCYRTVEETYATALAIVAAHPDLATWFDVGDSWEKTESPTAGYDLMVLRLTNSAVPGPKPILFVNFAIHAREYTTAELGTRFAEYLVDNYGVDPDVTWILDFHEVHLLLQTNPDGRKQAETGLSWRKNTDNDFCSNTNSRGVDLNRNFDFEWGCCGGSSGSQCDVTYRGPLPASEPEVQAVETYVASIFPDQRPGDLTTPAPSDATGVALDIHSYGELVLWPWGFTAALAPNGTALQTLGRKFAYFNGHTPQQGIELYPTDGTTDSFYYGELGVAGYGFELGTTFFQSCSTFEASILPGNLAALLYAAKVVRTPYLTPAGPEALSVAASPQPVVAGTPVDLTAVVDDGRFNNTNGTEPTQAIAGAYAFVDVPPWDAAAVALAMGAGDGTFDEVSEAVATTLDTSTLAPGRHLLFVQGVDALGNAGPVSAAFLDVVDPATAPIVQGTVRDVGTLDPLAATVTIGGYATATNPVSGIYSLQVPPGTYDVTAMAAGYLPATAPGVVADELDVVTQDFDLVPLSACTTVDFDDGSAAGWLNSPASTCTTGSFVVATPTEVIDGGVVTQVGGDHTSGTGNAFFSAVNTAAGTDDVDGGACIVESPVYPVAAPSSLTIWYFHGQRDAGGDAGDHFLLDLSTDGGSNWTPLAAYGDETVNAAWTEATASVPAGADVKLRVDVADGTASGDLVEAGVDDLWICPTAAQCSVPADCDDGLYCNGAETCAGGFCQAGSDPCAPAACDEVTDTCMAGPTEVTFTSVAAEDGWVLESKESSNSGGSNDAAASTPDALRVGDANRDRQYKVVVSFDTSAIPDGATILSATLRLRRGTSSGIDPFTTHGTCWVDVQTGGFSGSTALQDSDFEAVATVVQAASLSQPVADGDWSEGSLGAAGLAAIDKTGTTQLRGYFALDDNDDHNNDYVGFYAGDDATAANRPQLVVVYQ